MDTGYITSIQVIVVLLSSLYSGYIAVMEKILEIIWHYKYLRISCEREIKPGGWQNIYQNNLIFSASDY